MYLAPFSHAAAADYKVTYLSRTSYRPKMMTTSIGSKSAAEPHDRVAKESQLQRESI